MNTTSAGPTISELVRDYALSRGWIEPDASPETVKRIVAEKMRDGEFSVDVYARLLSDDNRKMLERARASLADETDPDLVVAKKALVRKLERDRGIMPDDELEEPDDWESDDDDDERPEFFNNANRNLEIGNMRTKQSQFDNDDDDDPSAFLVGGGSATRHRGPDVKRASLGYDNARTVAKNVKTGLPVRDERGREVENPSRRDMAKFGAFLRHRAARSGLAVTLNDHERDLVDEMYAKDRWCGPLGGEWHTDIPASRAKALLNDGTSGGQEVVPIWFDDLLVTFPLLHSELLPHVRLVEVPRGSAVEGASVGNPTLIWGATANDGGGLSLFNTASLVNELNTSIHAVAVAIEVGNDFLADSVGDVGTTLYENIGERMMAELDRVIAVGNGSDEPQGVFLASGTSTVSSVNGSTGSFTVLDFENMMRTLGKAYRQTRSPSIRWLSNDTSYWRARGIPVDTTDQRRVFGMDHEDYTLMARPWSVQNDIGNTKLAFGDFSRYRLYRRAGAEIRWERGGKTLLLNNTSILYLRARYGGRVMDGNAFAIMSTAPR